MMRVLFFLALAALIAFGVVWIADRPGDVAITWQGYRIETSVMVAAAAIAVVIFVALAAWAIIRNILRVPDLVSTVVSQRRGVRGYLAVSRGLIAVGAGDARAARKAAEEVQRIAPNEPLALLLNAQNAQLSGNRAEAEHAFRVMTERDDTRLLGLRGLYVEARRRNDMAGAQGYAEEAARVAPTAAWASQAVLEFRCAAGDWSGALTALDHNSRNGLLERDDYRRQRAVLLIAQAMAAEETDKDKARALALEAVKLVPTFVPAADMAGRLLGENNEIRRAARVIEKAWHAQPHPDLADTYAHLRPGDSARERLARVQSLAEQMPLHSESGLAVARAALDAREFAIARDALKPLLKEPTQRVALLMAELERVENADEGRARAWMARAVRAARDPQWTAEGVVSDRWMPVSPGGRLDAFQWKVPLAELPGSGRDIIDVEEPEVVREPAPELPPAAESPPADVRPPPQPEVGPNGRRATSQEPPRADPVMPLVHVPDDPGPEPERDPEPETPAGARGSRPS
jgi:HemY protein